MHCLSATVLAEADLVGLGIQVPQVLIPQHPAVIEGVAVGAHNQILHTGDGED